MRFRVLAVGAAIVASAAFVPNPVVAASLPGAASSQTAVSTETLVEEVRRGGRRHGHRHRGHRHHFHRHRHRHFHRHFRHRHFYRPYPYYYGSCTRVRYNCADYWGWGTWEFYRCIRSRGC